MNCDRLAGHRTPAQRPRFRSSRLSGSTTSPPLVGRVSCLVFPASGTDSFKRPTRSVAPHLGGTTRDQFTSYYRAAWQREETRVGPVSALGDDEGTQFNWP